RDFHVTGVQTCTLPILVRRARDRGLPVVVHRPARVGGHSRTGAGNPDDQFGRMLATCVRLGMVPDLPNEEDLAPVDYVAAAIGHLITDPEATGDFHYYNSRTITYPKIAEALGADCVPWDTWRVRAAALGPASPMAPFAQMLEGGAPQFRRPVFDCGPTERGLARAGRVGPPAGGDPVRGSPGRRAVLHAWGRARPAALGPVSASAPSAQLLAGGAPQSRRPVFDCGPTARVLARAGIVCPPADGDLIRLYAGRMEAINA